MDNKEEVYEDQENIAFEMNVEKTIKQEGKRYLMASQKDLSSHSLML